MANITGTIGNDVINGTVDADVIDALDGQDKVTSGGGNDIVTLGAGNDWVNGGAGDDKLYGGIGNDTLTGDAGNDELFGEEGNDGFFGGGGNDTLSGGAGNDIMYGDGANDTIDGGANDDKLYGGSGNDMLTGGAGTDIISGDAGNDTFTVRAGEGSDTALGGLGIDTALLQLTSADVNPALVAELKVYDAWAKAQLASAGGDINVLAAQAVSATFTFAELGGVTIASEVISIEIDGNVTPLGLIINEAPVADATAAESTNEDTVLSGQIVASDPNGDPLSCAVDTGPANGLISMNAATGAFVYTPNANFHGSDTFTVKITDQWNASVMQTVTVTVNSVNDAPEADAAATISTLEDTAVTGTVGGTDADGDALTYLVSSAPSNGTVTIDASTGEYSYTPAGDYSGSDSFVVTVKDPSGASAQQTISVTVAAVADAPDLSASSINAVVGVSLTGTAGNDTLNGTSGNDVISGGNGNDVINGSGAGNLSVALGITAALKDTDGSESISSILIAGLGTGDSLSAGTKNLDGTWSLTAAQLSGLTLTAAGTADVTLTITATSLETSGATASTTVTQHVTIDKGTDSDVLDGGAGNDTITGGSGNNTLIDGAGNDTVNGGGGNDTFKAGLGNDTFNGGTGSDTIDFSAATGAITANLLTGTATGMGSDTLLNFENAIGSDFNDTITGSNSNGYFDGGKGNDTISGGGGHDTIIGGDGSDNLRGGDGNDTLSGGAGDDTLRGNNGNDYMYASAGDDSYRGDNGFDTVDYSAATSAISVDMDEGEVIGWGEDELQSIEKVIGSSFNDYFEGISRRADQFDGGAGNDRFLGRTGSDILTGGTGDDRFIWRSADFWGSRGTVGQDKVTDFTAGDDVLDVTSLTAGRAVASVYTVTDTLAGTAITAVVGVRTYDVVLLEGVHGVTLASLMADGSLLV